MQVFSTAVLSSSQTLLQVCVQKEILSKSLLHFWERIKCHISWGKDYHKQLMDVYEFASKLQPSGVTIVSCRDDLSWEPNWCLLGSNFHVQMSGADLWLCHADTRVPGRSDAPAPKGFPQWLEKLSSCFSFICLSIKGLFKEERYKHQHLVTYIFGQKRNKQNV